MKNRFLRLIQFCVLSLDLLHLNTIAFALKLWLPSVRENNESHLSYVLFWMVLNLCWLSIAWISNVYHEKYIMSFEAFSKRTMRGYFYWIVLIMFYLYFLKEHEISRLYIGSVILSYGILLILNRALYLVVRYYFKQRNYFIKRVMIVGYNDTAKKLVSYLEEEGMNTEIIGFCEEEENIQELSPYPIISSISNTVEVSRHYQVDEIYSTIAPEHDLGIYNLIQQADQSCIHFRLIPDLSYLIKWPVHINYLRDIPVLSLRREPLSDEGNRIKKRLFDIVVSLFVVVFILSWMIPIIGLLIWLESPGPIFFGQLRTGRGKKDFTCLKFRSMKVNKDAHTKQATKNDDRLTRVGKILRRTSLDEFPQFINVLKGEMSVVGPRPHMLKHTDEYSRLIEKYMIRQFLKPGITGWAQVNGYRGETKTVKQMQGRVEHDLWYMENWSFYLDFKIIVLTFVNILKGDKSAF